MPEPCVFCSIVNGAPGALASEVLRDAQAVAFLDARPLFLGHVLVVPRLHHETLLDLPAESIQPLFATVQRVARAVEHGLGSDGTFVAINNRVSQSVPHLHVHVVPRRRRDGLRGFFWPRKRYGSPAERDQVATQLRAAL